MLRFDKAGAKRLVGSSAAERPQAAALERFWWSFGAVSRCQAKFLTYYCLQGCCKKNDPKKPTRVKKKHLKQSFYFEKIY